jgi:predicted RNA-binding Zn ribbon-like protein
MNSKADAGSRFGLVLAARRDLCLDFVNTLAWRGSTPSESLHTIADVAAWCASSGAILAGALEDPAGWAAMRPGRAVALFREAIEIRESLYSVFHAIASGGHPAEQDLSAINGWLERTPRRKALRMAAAGFGWAAGSARVTDAPTLLAPVLWSAGDLLTGNQLARVRECANSKCLWIFLDESKNGTRRWCSMSACGNRAKAHRHYARKKAG